MSEVYILGVLGKCKLVQPVANTKQHHQMLVNKYVLTIEIL